MKREKILRSHTIIPQRLYVERAADNRLKQIVMDMGRPGYVLVARQMGKTNLLLNAKRTLGNGVDKFIYLDVSNTFIDIQQFFRNIVDVAIDSYFDDFSKVGEVIKKERLKANEKTPPHKEHENELRALIRATEGRVVICLDEIDALTRTSYADLVFSLIRSIYFSGRINVPEFERLTYVLSGVAEPAELIRNKDVSPFNIGEKIFLDDFSRDELELFIRKAELPFQKEIIDEIFNWANGNPRMSWDICATLEDTLIERGDVSVDDVNRAVKEMYLTHYDLPPIDHIRMLVEADNTVRDAIMSIHWGQSESISDSVRNKLYLAGIARPNQSEDRAIAISNKILLESLSINWIQDLERKELTLFDIADKQFKKGFYAEALPIFEESIINKTNKTDLDLTYYRIGNCQYMLARYAEAINNFSKTNFGSGSTASIYYSIEHMTGLSYVFLDKPAESVKHFRNVLEQDVNGEAQLVLYFDACINLSTALFFDFRNNQEEIFELNNSVIELEPLVRKSATSNYPANAILYLANYNHALAYKALGKLKNASIYFDKAINLADLNGQVAILVELVAITEDPKIRKLLLEKYSSSLFEGKLAVRPVNKNQPLGFTSDVCVKLIEQLQENACRDSLDKLVAHLFDKSILHEVDAEDVLTKAVFGLVSRGNSLATLTLIKTVLKLPHISKSGDSRRMLLTIGILLSPIADASTLSDEFISEYVEGVDSHLVATDYRVIWELVRRKISVGNLKAARAIVNRVDYLCSMSNDAPLNELTEAQIKSGWLVVDALAFDLLVAEDCIELAQEKASSILMRLDKINSIDLPYFDAQFLQQLRKRIRNKTSEIKAILPVRRTEEKVGRNQIVSVVFTDGSVATGKYKKFQAQIISGECKLVTDSSNSA